MLHPDMTEFNTHPPDQERTLPVSVLIKMLGHLAIHVYEHLPVARNQAMPLFGQIEQELASFPQPLHPDIPAIAENIHDLLVERSVAPPDNLSFSNKFTRSTRMIQFTDRLTNADNAFFQYSSMKILKDHFVDRAEKQAYPLSFDQQLTIALDVSNNNITGALTKLWLASRHYARWLDSVSILNLPDFTPEEMMQEMKEWRGAILACKNADSKNFQDTAGDSYYAWTHARARVMFGIDSSLPDRIGKLIFQHGTTINTHRLIEQSIPSDHRVAAKYGNAIGDAILRALKTT